MSTYRHSGRFTAAGLVAGLFAGVTAGIVLAFVYSYATVYIPVVGWFTFILSLGFGALVGLAAGFPMHFLKVRNKGVGGAVALVSTLVAFWMSWVVWVYATLNRADIAMHFSQLLTSPGFLWDAIGEINEVGAWSLKSWTPQGTILWVFWGLEAVLVIGAGWFMGMSMLSDPFCESCESWCGPQTGILTVAGTEPADMKQRVEGKDLPWVQGLGAVPEGALDWFRFDTFECTCRKTCTLSVHHVTLKVEKGKMKEETSPVVENLLVTADESDAVRGIASRLEAGFAAAAA